MLPTSAYIPSSFISWYCFIFYRVPSLFRSKTQKKQSRINRPFSCSLVLFETPHIQGFEQRRLRVS